MQRKTPIFRLCHSRTHVRLVQYVQLPENGGWFRQKAGAPIQTLENLEMKKTLVALAALAATSAFAQSSVTLSGNLDQTYYNASGVRKFIHNGNSTSLINIAGVESLGGGQNLKFSLTSELNLMAGQVGAGSTGAATAAAGKTEGNGQVADMFNRGANVTYEDAKLGGLTIGRQTDSWFSTAGAFNTTGSASMGSGQTLSFVGNTAALSKITAFTCSTHLPGYTVGTNGNNAVNDGNTGTAAQVFKSGVGYTSPKIAGATFHYLRGQQTLSGTANYGTSYSINWAQGPIKAGYGVTDNKDANGASAWKNTFMGASYTMGQYTLIANNNKTSFGGTAAAVKEITATAMGVNYKMNDKIDFSLSQASIKDTGTNKGTLTGVVGRYAVSKRTQVYAGWGTAKNQGTNMDIGAVYAGTTAGAGKSASSTMLGLKHTF
jgi:predicted porin